jgi:hypothetical protein
VVVFATQALVSVKPASFAVPAWFAAATIFSFNASMRRVARSSSATTRAYSPVTSGWVAPACIRSSIPCSSAAPESTGCVPSGWRSRSADMDIFFLEHTFESRV